MASPSVPTPLLRVAVALAAAGALASLGVHIASHVGLTRALVLELGFFAWALVAFGPVIAALIQRFEEENGPIVPDGSVPNPVESLARSFRMNGWMLRFLPVWERAVFGLLLAYTAVRMVLGFGDILSDPDAAGLPLPMASALWLYFFAVSVLFGRRLLALRVADA